MSKLPLGEPKAGRLAGGPRQHLFTREPGQPGGSAVPASRSTSLPGSASSSAPDRGIQDLAGSRGGAQGCDCSTLALVGSSRISSSSSSSGASSSSRLSSQSPGSRSSSNGYSSSSSRGSGSRGSSSGDAAGVAGAGEDYVPQLLPPRLYRACLVAAREQQAAQPARQVPWQHEVLMVRGAAFVTRVGLLVWPGWGCVCDLGGAVCVTRVGPEHDRGGVSGGRVIGFGGLGV